MNADNLLYLVRYRTLIQNFKKNAKARYFRPGHVNFPIHLSNSRDERSVRENSQGFILVYQKITKKIVEIIWTVRCKRWYNQC